MTYKWKNNYYKQGDSCFLIGSYTALGGFTWFRYDDQAIINRVLEEGEELM